MKFLNPGAEISKSQFYHGSEGSYLCLDTATKLRTYLEWKDGKVVVAIVFSTACIASEGDADGLWHIVLLPGYKFGNGGMHDCFGWNRAEAYKLMNSVKYCRCESCKVLVANRYGSEAHQTPGNPNV